MPHLHAAAAAAVGAGAFAERKEQQAQHRRLCGQHLGMHRQQQAAVPDARICGRGGGSRRHLAAWEGWRSGPSVPSPTDEHTCQLYERAATCEEAGWRLPINRLSWEGHGAGTCEPPAGAAQAAGSGGGAVALALQFWDRALVP